MHCYEFDVVLQEVPGEVSLCFSISGCPLQCQGCHSPFLWKKNEGQQFTFDAYRQLLTHYYGFATCVLFMGGEWHPSELTKRLKWAKEMGYKTCLYTGETEIDPEILVHLTYLKTGPWKQELGGLNSPVTNQIFKDVKTNTVLNHLFIPK